MGEDAWPSLEERVEAILGSRSTWPMATDAATIPPKEGLGALVVELPELDERQMHFMRARWLDQTAWLEGKAKLCQRRYYALRLVAIVGGVTVPALVSLNVSSDASSDVASTIAWTTFALSLLVATAVSVEGFFRYGERWRHYRRTAELMKSQGWQFFELSGAYESHAPQDGVPGIFDGSGAAARR